MPGIDDVLRDQCGVVARRQVVALGLGPAWAAVLFSWPAALSHDSALRADDGPGRRDRDESVIHVAVDRSRHVVEPECVRVHRITGFHQRVLWNLGPPRVRYEEAVLDVATGAGDRLASIAVLADACGGRRTTAGRLLVAAAGRPRLADRDWLVGVLADVDAGTCSVLEHGYLTEVERRHGLPHGRRQAGTSTPQ